MRVAIAGAGNVGIFIANDLRGAGHDVLLIEQNPAVARRAPQTGDGHRVARRRRLRGRPRCRKPASSAATSSSRRPATTRTTSWCRSSPSRSSRVPRVIARVNHPKNEWLFNENWGVDLSVSTPHLITALVDEAVSVGRLVRLLQFEGGQARLVEVTLADDSPVDRPGDQGPRRPADATIVAIVRDDHVVMPRGDTVFEAGDEVLAIVTPESEDEVRRILTGGLSACGSSPD